MRERFRNCSTCGRLAVELTGGYCSERCRKLAVEGYESPRHSHEALRAPTSALDARILVRSVLPPRLPEPAVYLGTVDGDVEPRHLVRAGLDEWSELERLLGQLREAVGDDAVQLFTLQRFAPGGLVTGAPNSNGGFR